MNPSNVTTTLEVDVETLGSIFLITYINVAAVAILLYDYLITFSREVDQIWRQSTSPVTLIFFFLRYMPMIDTTLLLVHEFAPIESEKVYGAVFKAQTWFYAVGVMGGLLILRTCAIWGNNIKIAIWLSVLLAMVIMPGAYAVSRYTSSLKFQKSDIPLVTGYFVSSADNIIFVSYASLLVFETVVLLLTLKKIDGQRDKSAIYKVLYWDSLRFYFCLFFISVANIIMLVAAPTVLKSIITQLHRILHSVVLGRIILNIRGAMKSKHIDTALSTMMFWETTNTVTDAQAQEVYLLGHEQAQGRALNGSFA